MDASRFEWGVLIAFEELTLEEVGRLRQVVPTLLEITQGDVVLDLAHPESMDASTLGLLLALRREVEAWGRALHILGAPDELPYRSPEEAEAGDALAGLRPPVIEA